MSITYIGTQFYYFAVIMSSLCCARNSSLNFTSASFHFQTSQSFDTWSGEYLQILLYVVQLLVTAEELNPGSIRVALIGPGLDLADHLDGRASMTFKTCLLDTSVSIHLTSSCHVRYATLSRPHLIVVQGSPF
jgi:hypothetical protein